MEGQEIVTAEVRTLAQKSSSGAMSLALMSEEEFAARLAAVKKGQERVRQIQRTLMVESEDYGTIPGTKKPTLLKPGAEKLAAFYGLIATYSVKTSYGDRVSRPWITVEVTAVMHLGAEDGPIVGQGLGSANSSEVKYLYRTAKRSCPTCGSVGGIAKSKFPDKKTGDLGWYCRDCKANYASTDEAITGQQLGQIENPDPADVENTILKMAKKRSYIDGVLTTTATSGLFTQDLEDMGGGADPDAPARVDPPARQPGDDDEPEWVSAGGIGEQPPGGADDRERKPAPPKGEKAPCPQCGKPAWPTKYPKAGAPTHYCTPCKCKFTPGGAR